MRITKAKSVILFLFFTQCFLAGQNSSVLPDTLQRVVDTAAYYGRLGEFSQEIEWYRKADAICIKLLGANSEQRVLIHNNISLGFFRLHQVDSAQLYLEKAIDIGEAIDPFPIELTTPYTNLGVVLRNRGQYERGTDLAMRALAVYKHYVKETDVQLISYTRNVGSSY